MRSIVFLDTHKSGSSREAIKAAERLGYFTIVLTDRPKLLQQRTEFPDIHQMILCNLRSVDSLREQIERVRRQGKRIHAVVSFVDPYVHTATCLAEELDVNRVSGEAVQCMEDKVLTRQALQGKSFCPYYAVYDEQGQTSHELAPFVHRQASNLPLVLKSPKSTGSKDVIKVDTVEELMQGILLLKRKYPKEPVLLEEYLDGQQFLVETVVIQGEVWVIAVVEQEILPPPRFIVTGYRLLAELPDELYRSVQDVCQEALEAMGMRNGACHLEMRSCHGEWKIVEINPRISGGAMNRMIEEAFGIHLVEETLKLHLGEKPQLTPKYRRYVYTQYVTLSRHGMLEKVTGKNRALLHTGVSEIYVKPRKGSLLRPPLSMGDRYAYVMASSRDSLEEARRTAREAAEEIRFHLLPA